MNEYDTHQSPTCPAMCVFMKCAVAPVPNARIQNNAPPNNAQNAGIGFPNIIKVKKDKPPPTM